MIVTLAASPTLDIPHIPLVLHLLPHTQLVHLPIATARPLPKPLLPLVPLEDLMQTHTERVDRREDSVRVDGCHLLCAQCLSRGAALWPRPGCVHRVSWQWTTRRRCRRCGRRGRTWGSCWSRETEQWLGWWGEDVRLRGGFQAWQLGWRWWTARRRK